LPKLRPFLFWGASGGKIGHRYFNFSVAERCVETRAGNG
jgi:hypothetical protein